MSYLQVLKLFKSKLKRGLAIVVATAALLTANSANAALLGLNLAPAPDIFSSFITVDYDMGTETLTADGFALNFFDGANNAIAGGTFSLTASIDNSGVLSGGSLMIMGTTAGFNSGTLLTGSITALGFDDGGGDPLEFMLDITGGDLAGMYGPHGGIIMTSTGLTANLFTESFSSGAMAASSDVGVPVTVPEPEGLLLLSVALMGLVAARRRSY
ncbi:PEP-CTERM sorting domain-containing protein [Thalassomonas viridans]|uniref:PEP-CTERM sorting domain-containing protein n=1 Tax=Thalassomonas viridans TaxID=137584 RepID=A0AAE9Z7Z5_9GAMM|nr:PEP-CTERM sorting domain-containing protein [Thalassomonas viridans]WDE07684.1 PEP-CTERM sorting domain-containing protein [Thalassomonas viridans]